MRRRASPLCMVVVVVAGLWAPRASAQVYDRPLTDQDLERLIPALRAEKAGAQRLARQAREREALEKERSQARERAVEAIAAGTDPLSWLTGISSNAAAPSTARYQPACSRSLTQSAAVPSAVFSFGIAAPSTWLAVWRARDPEAAIGSPQGRQQGAQRPGATTPERIVQQTRAFYASRGFQYEGEPAPFEWQFLAPDQTVASTVTGVNVLGRIEACRSLATGPTVLLKAEGGAFAKGPARPGPATNRELAQALDKAGLSEDEYLNLKLQLQAAQADANDPARLATPAEGTEAQQKTLAIRRQNAEFYRRHADVIAPLLARG